MDRTDNQDNSGSYRQHRAAIRRGLEYTSWKTINYSKQPGANRIGYRRPRISTSTSSSNHFNSPSASAHDAVISGNKGLIRTYGLFNVPPVKVHDGIDPGYETKKQRKSSS
jgi:hypothetical protein